MCSPASAKKPPLYLSYPESVIFRRAKIIQDAGSLGLFLKDEVINIKKLIEKLPPTAYIDIELDKMPCRVFSFKDKMEDQETAFHYLRRCGFNPLVESDAARLWRSEACGPMALRPLGASREFYLDDKTRSIHSKEQNFFVFHVHFLYPLKACLSQSPALPHLSLEATYKATNPFGIAVCGDTLDPTTPQIVTVQKLQRLSDQFFSNQELFERKLHAPSALHKSIVIISVAHPPSAGSGSAAAVRKDYFIFKKFGHDRALIVIPDDGPQWKGSFKVARFALFIFNKIQPCIVNICNDEIDFEQEILIRTHPLIEASAHIPQTIAHWKTDDQQIFISEFACYGSLEDFLLKKTALPIKARIQLVHSLLDRFIGTEFFLHKDIKKANLLVHRRPGRGYEILINDLGSSALKQAACEEALKAIQAKKVKELTTNTYLLSPELILMFYEKTRKQAAELLLKKAEAEGKEVDEAELAIVQGKWSSIQMETFDGHDGKEFELTNEHWEKSTVFTLGQIIFEILFGFDLYMHFFDKSELDAAFPFSTKTFDQVIRDPLARACLEDTEYLSQEDLETLIATYQLGHTAVLELKRQMLEEKAKKEEGTFPKHPLLDYPEEVVRALTDPDSLSLLEHELLSLAKFDTVVAILHKAHTAMLEAKRSAYFSFLAKFICLNEIDIEAAVPTTIANANLKRRLSVIAQMLSRDKATRITLGAAKAAFTELDTVYPL